jgi:hypothetical protein
MENVSILTVYVRNKIREKEMGKQSDVQL